MTRPRGQGERPERDAADRGFDFGSPRWRESEPGAEGPANRQRRFRNDLAPGQRGSIDAADSVPRGAEARPRAHPPKAKPRDLLR